MRRIQVIPKGEYRLYGGLVAKEIELRARNQGTFRRTGKKARNHGKWSHKSYPGWIKLARGMGEVMEVEVRSGVDGAEWQLMQAILGFLDRHFAERIQAINIQY